MGANMRGVALVCSAFILLAVAPADAQTRAKRGATQAEPAKPADQRPRLKRDDAAAPVPNASATAPQQKKGRPARVPTGTVDPNAKAAADKARSTLKDVAACAQAKQPDAAIEGCGRVLEDQKQKPKARTAAYFNRGNAYLSKGQHDQAIADFDEAIKLDPKNASAYNNRGNAKSEKGEADAAIEDFNAAIKANPRYASAYFNRANSYATKGDAAALKDYDTALKHNRRNVNAYIARGALLLASGATAKARIDMRQAAALDRKNAYAVLWHDIAERRAKQKGVLAARDATKGLDMKAWPAPLVQLFSGESKIEAALAAAEAGDGAAKIAQVCEANFYGAEYALIEGRRDDAAKLFQTAATKCPHGFLEGIAAAAELKGLGVKVGAN
jgi:lipoprotein NlpI